MEVIKEIPKNCCIENFIWKYHNQPVQVPDPNLRRWLLAQAYYYGLKLNIVKEQKVA